jgi:hypothetical protein
MCILADCPIRARLEAQSALQVSQMPFPRAWLVAQNPTSPKFAWLIIYTGGIIVPAARDRNALSNSTKELFAA